MTEEFETEFEGILINGVDIIKFSDHGHPIPGRWRARSPCREVISP
jgi:hypothetical protein